MNKQPHKLKKNLGRDDQLFTKTHFLLSYAGFIAGFQLPSEVLHF